MADSTSRDAAARPMPQSELRDVNALVRARIGGRISRRDLIRRAAALGVSAPVVGVMLHLTSDYAYGAPSNGRTAALADRLAGGTIPADAPTKPAGTPQQGGTLVVGTTEEPDTLNPYITGLVVSSDILSAMMEGLLAYDSKEQLQPALATALPEISADGLTYTFKLRQGVKFHNGDPFTPQDVIDTWKMIVNKDFAAASTLGWDKITGITAPDEQTVVIKTSEVYAPFISYVGPTVISPSKALAAGPDKFKQDFGQAPIGTGPMKFTEWKHKDQVVFERFPDYWGGKAKLDKVIHRNLGTDNTTLVQLRTGEVQLAGLSAAQLDEALKIDKVDILEYPSMAWSHLDLKNIDFLTETPVRQALDFATPSQQIIDQLLKGRALPSVADQAPGTWAFNPNIKPRPYDPEQAKKLLDGAGLKPGSDGVRARDGKKLEIELWGIAGEEQQTQIIEVIAQAWSQIGVRATTHFQDTSTLWGPEGYQWNKKMTACLYAWFNGNDPDDMYYWHSSQIPSSPTGTGGNAIAYFNKFSFQDKIDALTSQAVKEVDQEKRKQLYWQIQELLHEEVPVIFIYWNKGFDAATKNLGGYLPSAFTHTYWNVQDWYLAK